MAEIFCLDFTKSQDDAINPFMHMMEANADDAISQFIGYPRDAERQYSKTGSLGKKALNAYNDLRSTLKKDLLTNGTIFKDYDMSMRIEQFKDYMQYQTKMPGLVTSKGIGVPSEYTIIASNKIIKSLVNEQKTKFGKLLTDIERQFLPVIFYALKSDPFGYIHRYIKKVSTIVEESRSRYGKFTARYNEIYRNMQNGMMNILSDHIANDGIIDYSWTMVDPKMSAEDILNRHEGVPGVFGNNMKEYIFLGSKKTDDGSIVHDVIDRESSERVELDYNEISIDEIKNGMYNKYAYGLVKEIMDGQTRYVKWSDNPNPRQQEIISNIINEMSVVHQADPNELKKGKANVHRFVEDGVTYRYIMVKDDPLTETTFEDAAFSGSLREGYTAFIISATPAKGKTIQYFKKSDKKLKKSVKSLETTKDGFYRSTKWKQYAKRPDKYGKISEYSSTEQAWDFGTTKDTRMVNQPKNNMINFVGEARARTGAIEERIKYRNLWQAISVLRDLFVDVSRDMNNYAGNEKNKAVNWFQPIKGTNKTRFEGIFSNWFEGKDLQEMKSIFERLFDIHSKYWTDEDGNINTPNSSFTIKSFNYFPRLYKSGVIDWTLDRTIEDMNNRLGDIEEGTQEYTDLQNQINEIMLTRAKRTQDDNFINNISEELGIEDPGEYHKMTIAEKNVYTKHRSAIMDPMMSRSDPKVFEDYLNHVYYSFEKNNVMLSALETLGSLANNKIPKAMGKAAAKWIVNRTRAAMYDPNVEANLFGMDMSYGNVAKWMNRLIPGKREWDSKSAEKFINYTKGLISGALLGHNSALINRTQIINDIIPFGFKYLTLATKALEGGDRSKWEAIIDNAGTDEITNMLFDILAQGSDIKLRDAGLINTFVLPFQIPTPALRDWLKMIARDRRSYIENGMPEIDKQLSRIEIERINKLKNEDERIRLKKQEIEDNFKRDKDRRKYESMMKLLKNEESRLSGSEKGRRDIKQLRENFLDLLLADKENSNRKLLEARFKNILGDVERTRLQRMITWKLGWWFTGDFGKSMFTFTESERTMRKQSVIMNLLVADTMGLLGSSKKKIQLKTEKGEIVEVEERFLTDDAIRIARNGVSSSMFGMSVIHQGDAFLGAGGQVMLYKTYPIQQMYHDWKIVKTFMKGGTFLENTERLKNSMVYLAQNWGKPFNPSDAKADLPALNVLRFVGTRTAMSFIGVGIESLGVLKYLIRSPLLKNMQSMVRGGENPAFHIAIRLLVNVSIFAMMDDDERDSKDLTESAWNIMRLFLPVFLTLPLATANKYLFN